MESVTIRTDMVKDSEGRHQKIVTTMTVKMKDVVNKDDEPSHELHDSVEVVAYEPEPKPSIDQARPCTSPGKPAEYKEGNWLAPSSAANWPTEME